MLEFLSVDEKPISFYSRFFRGSGICNSDKTVTCKKMWSGFNASFALVKGCLVIKNDSVYFGMAFDFPLAGEDGDVDGALCEIEDYCMKKGQGLAFCCLSADEQAYLARRYFSFSCENDRNYRDYIYSASEMSEFKGKRFSGQRNHINKFLSLFPQASFRFLDESDKDKIKEFFREWKNTVMKSKTDNAAKETELAERTVLNADFRDYKVGGVDLNGKIIAMCFGEIVKSTLVIHVEKALHSYEGVNVFLVREFARACSAEGNVEFINREDDSGEEGLRTSKLQYHPIEIRSKFFMEVKSEVSRLRAVPKLKTDRLTLGMIKLSEAKEYYRLCSDDSLNRYWGYDYRDDLEGELNENYFYNVARADFSNEVAVNFAVRLDGKFIGETVMFEFNFRGECKIGVRILPEFAGNGYGKEAFERTVKFALYGLGIKRVLSSCYKANIPSVKMHDELMKRCGADDERYYYERSY